MNKCIKMVLAFATILAFQFSFNASATAAAPKLTAAQCKALNTALQDYITFTNKYFGNGPLIQKLIADAKADVLKVCPAAAPSNGFTADTENECGVLDSTSSFVVSLGLDASGNLTNSSTLAKTACMSQNACTTLISQKFVVFNSTSTSRCSDPNDQTVLHLSDSAVQTKLSQLP